MELALLRLFAKIQPMFRLTEGAISRKSVVELYFQKVYCICTEKLIYLFCQPMLSRDATCDICGKGDSPRAAEIAWCGDINEDEDWSSWLMECRVCYELVHPACLRERHPEITCAGVLDEDVPSSWDCCRCCERGLQGQCRVGCINVAVW
jgi:PHD-finger